ITSPKSFGSSPRPSPRSGNVTSVASTPGTAFTVVLNLVHTFNACRYKRNTVQDCEPKAYDFARLYTNTPSWLSPPISLWLRITVDSFLPRPQLRPGQKRQCTTHRATFVAAGACPALKYRIRNAYHTQRFFMGTFIRLGHAYVRQVKGIPTASPAPVIAHLFLGWFEYKFVRQRFTLALPPYAKAVMRQIVFICRFLDNLCCLCNVYLGAACRWWLKHTPTLPQASFFFWTFSGLARTMRGVAVSSLVCTTSVTSPPSST
ncbi:hypothetical protein TSOC_014826, partial [Tetrabaena socialis]